MITVAGGGVGGLAAALLLARNGHSVRVFERRTAPPAEGAGIQLSPNASRILLAAGLGETLARGAVAPDALLMGRFGSDEVRATLPLAELARRFGAPYWCLAARTCMARCTRRLGANRRVTVTMGQDAPAPDHADDLTVAAEGLWSGPAPRFTGWEAWRATIAIGAAPPEISRRDVGLRLGANRHLVHYPVRGGAALNLVLVEAASAPREGWTRAGDPDRLAPALRAASPSLRALLRTVETWQVWSLYERAAAPMARGRVALLGDAAHPVSPFLAQGAALAIEDAAVLAAALGAPSARFRAGVPAALTRYDAERRPRAARVQAAARENGRIYHLHGPLAAARDLTLRVLGPERALRRYDWLYGWRPPES